jgi:glyoxalase/bleomycin resistance protein/dioxygenase superfamily protein
MAPPFEALDFVYMPSSDAAADVRHFTEVLGGELVFAIERFGTRVAMVQLTPAPPAVLLAEHLEGERPILVFRVDDLDGAVAAVEARGFEVGERFGIPHGPGCMLEAPGGQRLALYQLTRPGVVERLVGRRDF